MRFLYIDESFNTKDDNQIMFLGGLSIAQQHIRSVKTQVGLAKDEIFKGLPRHPRKYIFHEAEAQRSYYHGLVNKNNSYNSVFKDETIFHKMYKKIGDIFDDENISILGVLLDSTNQYKLNVNKERLRSQYHSAFYNLVDLFVQQLIIKNEVGVIISESRSTKKNKMNDDILRGYYYHILANGTYRYKAQAVQHHLRGIQFVSKGENDAMLQLADFVGGPVIRNYMGEIQPKPGIWQKVRKRRYNAGIQSGESQFGIKIIK